ncbi:hypothetical protein ACUNWD_17110 [Sunxiuqinia sp. A32]|uniref:hypothetical protein n=1 Tax=Sunxiuqinia sp. A32 TaxID=3461496 RepID=UPI00404615B1
MNSARTFVNYFTSSYHLAKGVKKKGSTLRNEFLEEFVVYIPEIIEELEGCIQNNDVSTFYHKLNNLKFLCEYTDTINRYWYLLRAYSGGLMRLADCPNQQKAVEVYIYYYNKYGGRRILKDENWFENLRWKFLDQLIEVEDDKELYVLIDDTYLSLAKFFDIYKTELLNFLQSVKEIIN